MNFAKRYVFFIVMIAITGLLVVINNEIGFKAINITMFSFKQMIFIIPPIFVLLGLLDVWVPKETIVKYMGENSGLKGMALSIFMGSATAGPLYGAFPVAAIFMKKGAKFTNVLLFIGAWSTTKIPMILFEISALGLRFAMTRLVVSLVGIFLIAYMVTLLVNEKEMQIVYEQANN